MEQDRNSPEIMNETAAGFTFGSLTVNRSLGVPLDYVLSHCPRSVGEVPERSNGAVSKTVVPLAGDRGFESLPLRQKAIRKRPRPSNKPY